MILDKHLIMSDKQDIKAISGASTAVDSNIISVGKADFGYKGCFLVVKTKSAIQAPSADGNVTIKLLASDKEDFSSGVVTLAEKTFVNFAKTSGIAKDTVLLKDILRDCKGLKYLKTTYAGDGTWAKNSGDTTIEIMSFITPDIEDNNIR